MKEKVTVPEELPLELEESLTVMVRINQKFFWIMVYNPSETDKFCFIEKFENVLDTLSAKNYRVKKCGHFIFDILKSKNLSSEYIDSIEGNGFDQIFKQPTRKGKARDTLLDHMIGMIVKDVKENNGDTLQD